MQGELVDVLVQFQISKLEELDLSMNLYNKDNNRLGVQGV